jgi:chemotaxis signal transduction protein
MTEPPLESEPRADTAAVLRRLFDASFAAPVQPRAERATHLLAIRVGGDPYALRLSEIAGLQPDLKVIPIPTPAVQLLGIAALRGMMAPIYDLAALLGYSRAPNPRWIVFARAPQPVGLAFEVFESHLQVSDDSLAGGEAEDPGSRRSHAQQTVRAAGVVRPLIHMASVMATLKGLNS